LNETFRIINFFFDEKTTQKCNASVTSWTRRQIFKFEKHKFFEIEI